MADDSSLLESSEVSDISTTQRRRCCRPSPYPVYLSNVIYFLSMVNNLLGVDAILYNKLCYAKYKNISLCTNATFTSEHPILQQEVAQWGNYNTLAMIPLYLLANLLLSSYCDKMGHKLPYLLPMLGNFLATAYMALWGASFTIGWDMNSIFALSVLSSMFGGFPLVVMSSFSYLALVTPKEKMSVGMAVAEGTLLLGVLIGTVTNGPIIDTTSISTLMLINAAITFIPVIIIVTLMTDVTSDHGSGVKHTWRDVIGVKHAFDAVRCVFKQREGNKRLVLQLCYAAYTCSFICSSGYVANSFLYFVKEQGMSMTEYSVFNAFLFGFKSFAGPGVLFFVNKWLKPNKNNIMVGACASITLGYAVMSIKYIPHCAWIGAILLGGQTVLYGELRSLQTSLCGKDEFGKLFSYDAIIQLTLGAAASIGFKALYSFTLNSWPSLFLALSGALHVVAMVIVAIIDRLMTEDEMVAETRVNL